MGKANKLDNKVELLGYYGSDEVIACSAWTSTSRNLTDEKRGRIQRLIEMLWINGHETPFEKATVHFLVDTDIASHIHLLKHRISSLNAESARYKELKEDKYYLPEDWKGITNSDYVGFGSETIGRNEITWLELLESYTKQVMNSIINVSQTLNQSWDCLLYTSQSPRD